MGNVLRKRSGSQSGSPSTPAAAASKTGDDSYVKFAREFIEESVENQPPNITASSSEVSINNADNSKSLPDLLQPEETYKKQSDTLSETDTADYESAIDSDLSSANDSFVTDDTHSPSAVAPPALDISALCRNVAQLYLETPQKPVKSADSSALDTTKVFDLFQGDFSGQSLDSSDPSYGSFPTDTSSNRTLDSSVLAPQQLFGAESEGSFTEKFDPLPDAESTNVELKLESCIAEEDEVAFVEFSPVVPQETQGDITDGNVCAADQTDVVLDQEIQTLEATSTVEPDVSELNEAVFETTTVQKVQVDEPIEYQKAAVDQAEVVLDQEIPTADDTSIVESDVPERKVELAEQTLVQQVQVDEPIDNPTVDADHVPVKAAVEVETAPTDAAPVEAAQVKEEVVLESSPVVPQVAQIIQDNILDGNIHAEVVLDQKIQTVEAPSTVEPEVSEIKEAVFEHAPVQQGHAEELIGNQSVAADQPEVVFDQEILPTEATQPALTVESGVAALEVDIVEQAPVQVDEPIGNLTVAADNGPVSAAVDIDEPIGNLTVAADHGPVSAAVDVETIHTAAAPVDVETTHAAAAPVDVETIHTAAASVDVETTHAAAAPVDEEIPIQVIQTDLPVVQIVEATPPKPVSSTELEITVSDIQCFDFQEQASPNNIVVDDLPEVEELATVELTTPASVPPPNVEVNDIGTNICGEIPIKLFQATAQVPRAETAEQVTGRNLSLNSLKALCRRQENDLIQHDDFSVRQSLADFLASEAQQISQDIHNSSQEECTIPDTLIKQNSPVGKVTGKDILLLTGFKNTMSATRKADESVPLDVKWLSDSRANSKDIERRSPAPDTGASGDSTQIKKEAQNDSSLNHSEAGPETAQNIPASEEVFADSAGFDFLSTISSSQPSRRLGLESLYVKFDPLVSAPPSKSAVPPPPLFHEAKQPQPAAMSTPPKNPALASIERLINISPSPKKQPAPAPAPAVKQEAVSMDSAAMLQELLKLQDVLTEQDKKDQAAVAERTLLKSRVAELEAQLADAAHESDKLSKKAAERTQSQQQMSLIMEEYEKTISRLVAEKEHDKQLHAAQMDSVNKEKESALHHLSNIEIAFSDVHKKYERSKTVIDGFRKNEEVLRDTLARYEETVRKQDQKYDMLKSHAMSQLESANKELDNVRRSHQAECAKLKAMLKKSELKATSLEEMMEQKQKENLELASICDDLIAKVTS